MTAIINKRTSTAYKPILYEDLSKTVEKIICNHIIEAYKAGLSTGKKQNEKDREEKLKKKIGLEAKEVDKVARKFMDYLGEIGLLFSSIYIKLNSLSLEQVSFELCVVLNKDSFTRKSVDLAYGWIIDQDLSRKGLDLDISLIWDSDSLDCSKLTSDSYILIYESTGKK